MRISIGKIENITSQGQNSAFRVPISSIAFQPVFHSVNEKPPPFYRLLVAGGSTLSLWFLSLSDTAVEEKKPAADDKQTGPKVDPKTFATRWLYAELAAPRISCERLFSASDHAPAYVTRVKWSPEGVRFASADGFQIFVWEQKDQKQEAVEGWHRAATVLEPSVGEIFDFDWVTPDIFVIGGIGRVTLRKLEGQTSHAVQSIPLAHGSICKGICTCPVSKEDSGTHLVAISINIREVMIVELDVKSMTVRLVFVNEELFREGPHDAPLIRHCCFDCEGRSVAFSYGERRGDSFGALFDVDDLRRAEALSNSREGDENFSSAEEKEKAVQELLRDCQFRVRGHQARVNVVAFGNALQRLSIRPSTFLKNEQPEQGYLRDFVDLVEKFDEEIMNYTTWPYTSKFAQASVDGCLSIWDVYRSQNGNALAGQCLLATPNSIVDQTGLVTDLSWSPLDDILAVASDDGKLTLVVLEDSPQSTQQSPQQQPATQTSAGKRVIAALRAAVYHPETSLDSRPRRSIERQMHVEDVEEKRLERQQSRQADSEEQGLTSPLIMLTPQISRNENS